MPSQSLYRRWRSKTFAEIVGQGHVTTTLANALRSGRVSHAYLFCGPRGTGKTSTARLLAKAVNCENREGEEPCNRCEMCVAIQENRAIDLVEIDAASNRGIDEIRELREKVSFMPSQARYKVYILDEAHMLTTEAFNALLKTLEEPPPHAIFVLVTTEPHKIPPTITSRCQRFDFRRVALADLLSKLRRICDEEGLAVDPSALELVARTAGGSFRDAESLLDQLASYADERISLAFVQRLLGLIPAEAISTLVEYLISRQTQAGLQTINQVSDSGLDLRQYGREIVEYLRGLLLIQTGNSDLLGVTPDALATMTAQATGMRRDDLVRALRLFSQVDQVMRSSPQPQLPLELAFLEAVSRVADVEEHTTGQEASQAKPSEPARPAHATSTAAAPRVEDATRPATQREGTATSRRVVADLPTKHAAMEPTDSDAGSSGEGPVPAAPGDSHDLDIEQVRSAWAGVLAGVKPVSRSIEGLLRGCEPIAVEDGVVVLGFYYGFHKDSIDNPKNRVIVEKVLSRVLAQPCRVRCVLTPRERGAAGAAAARVPPPSARERIEAAAQDPQIRAALEIFPGAEIAEVVE